MLPKIVADGTSEAQVRRAFMQLNDKVLYYLGRRDVNIALDDHSGAALAVGRKATVRFECKCSIVQATLLGDRVGSLKVDIWKTDFDGFPPTDADSICGGSELSITAGTKAVDADLSGWTTGIGQGDILEVNVDSCATIRRAVLHLLVELE